MCINSVLLNRIVFIAVLLCVPSAYAVLPTTLNYQGHLTDSAGVPIDGPVSMVFAIYDVETGGTALWSDTRSVTIDQGVFSVELGGTSNPFPIGLFDDPLWLGLTVASDSEMTPRRPLSSTAYSFKADDANTLEGVSASTLDQSAHVTDTANPHVVTTGQIGAADAADLASHTGNLSNPHAVTAAQVGAATAADLATHAADSSAHHTRYHDTEALAVMGILNDSNPLNHNRFTDSEAVAAVLAGDGAGSTLDADLVDGLQASELIDAAQDEVRTPISSLPYTISQPGSYYLTGNLDGSSGGIDITTDDVSLDLMGFTIDGGGAVSDHGIDFDTRNNISIRNGTVTGFNGAGILQTYTSVNHATVLDMKTLGNGTYGIYIASGNGHIERCTAGSNGGYGIYAGASSKLIDNTVYNNSGSYGIYAGINTIVRSNTAYNNASTGIYGSTGASLIDNAAYNNGGNGIYGGSGSSLSGNVAFNNTGYGIYGGSGANLSGNTARNNDGIYGIYGSTGANLIGNTASSNQNWGMYAYAANLVKDNTLLSNNLSGTTGQGGLRVGNDCIVVSNTLDGNSQNNMYIVSGDSILKENHVTDSTTGIFFSASGNYYKDNTGAGNTAFIDLNGTTQTDGGGNVSF